MQTGSSSSVLLELDVGKVCAECGHLDFLPVRCYYCTQFLCSDHSTTATHHCKAVEAQPEHFAGVALDVRSVKCACPSCQTLLAEGSSLRGVRCTRCNLLVCFDHCAAEAHNCAGLVEEKQSAFEQRERALSTLRNKTTASAKTVDGKARVINAMNSVGKSMGSSNDTSECVTLLVVLSQLRGKPAWHMHFPHTWTLGRVIDSIVGAHGLDYLGQLTTSWRLVQCESALDLTAAGLSMTIGEYFSAGCRSDPIGADYVVALALAPTDSQQTLLANASERRPSAVSVRC